MLELLILTTISSMIFYPDQKKGQEKIKAKSHKGENPIIKIGM